jgi:hypothetical protein
MTPRGFDRTTSLHFTFGPEPELAEIAGVKSSKGLNEAWMLGYVNSSR